MFVGHSCREASMTSVWRIFVRVLSLNVICLLIFLAFFWRTTHTDNEQLIESVTSNISDGRLRRPGFPLLCIFTTFKPDAQKLPV